MKSESERIAAARLTSELGFEVTRQMVREWKKKKWALDRDTLLAKIPNQERMPIGFVKPVTAPRKILNDEVAATAEQDLQNLQAQLKGAGDYEEARTITTKIRGIQIVLKELRQQGTYILKSEAQAAGMKAGNASKQKWEKLEDDLPPLLEGKEAAQMKQIIRQLARERCSEMSQLFVV
jgi:hypothetical protein